MSGHFNDTGVTFTAVDFTTNSPALVSKTFTGKTIRVGLGNQYYSFSLKFPPMTAYNFGPVSAFIAKQYGQFESFTITLPEISYNTGANKAFIGVPVTATSALSAGVKTCTISGMTANKNQVLRAGDFFKFNNHTKVYMCVDDLNTDATGKGTLNFAGSLLTNVPIGTGITTNAVRFTVINDNDVQEFTVGSGGMTSFSLKMTEVW